MIRGRSAFPILLAGALAASSAASAGEEEGATERLRGLLGAIGTASPNDRARLLGELVEAHRELVEQNARRPDPAVGGAIASSGWWLYRKYDGDAPIDRLEFLEQAFDGAKTFGDPGSIGSLASVLAGSLRDRGDLDGALARLGEAADRIAPEHPLAARVAVERADLLRHAGRTAAARELLDAVEASGAAEAGKLRMELDGVRGLLELAEGRPELAARSLARSAAAAREARDPIRYRNAVVRRLNLALAVEDAEGALALADEARAEEWAWGSAPAGARAQLEARRGHALAELERDDAAREPRAAAVLSAALAGGALGHDASVDARLSLAEVRLRAGALDEAAAELDVVARTVRPSREEAEDEGAALADRRRQARRHAVLSAILARERGADRDALAEHLARLEEELRAYLDGWRALPARADGRGFLHFGGPRQLSAEIVRLATRVEPGPEGVARALDALLAAQALGSVTRARGGVAPTVEEVRRGLAEDEVLLVYLPAPDASHLLLVDADRLEHHALASDMALFDERRAFLDVVARPPPREDDGERKRSLRASGAALRDALLPPAALGTVRSRRLWTVVGVDLLGTLPFEALPLDDDRWAGVEHAVLYSPSVPLTHVLREVPWRRDGAVDLAWVVDPTPPPAGAPPLRFGDAESARLFAAYAAGEAAGVRGAAATREGLEAAAASARVALHVWTHGVRDESRPIPAGLHLADGAAHGVRLGLLDAPPLVLLSSCGAARGPLRRGEDGASNLGGAFLRAGARAVVLPSVDVDEGATLALMEGFHAAWRGGASVAEALREARARLAGSRALSDPYHWAWVHAVGAGRTPAYPRDDSGLARRVGLVGAAVLAAVGLALAARGRLTRRRAGPPLPPRAPGSTR
ncbi:MAG: CHAT domain-containing protein [Planctomycetota bacterium JB042]